ncbi:hypothetical protein J4E08_23780 [Sagittula sp. NFXS13]|uniref:His/Gly/Thr/Pro-type tRNA ligase C-terminal domain-containing protein n=1 Tax=Sagittula sp. NFXS13 TaxID=2819095 RepID=UPI0032DEBF0B
MEAGDGITVSAPTPGKNVLEYRQRVIVHVFVTEGGPPLNHHSLARRLGLYSFDPAVPGGMSWHPCGWVLHRVLEEHFRRRLQLRGFDEVRTPVATCNHIVGAAVRTNDDGLPKAEPIRADSGHGGGQGRTCGGHLRLFDEGLKSWRELPIRYSEFIESGGEAHPDAQGGHQYFAASGALDAHVLCLIDQIKHETAALISMVRDAYADVGFPDLDLVLRPGFIDDMTVGAELEAAEAAFVGATMAAGVQGVRKSDGTLPTGPGLEFLLRNRKGRLECVGMLQLDVITASLNGTRYVARDGGRAAPAILHLTVVNSIARVIATLLEQHQGRLPFWMAPVQVAVLPVSSVQADVATHVTAVLKSSGLRPLLFAQRETLPRRIVRVREQLIPVVAVIGAREVDRETVSIRIGEAIEEVSLREVGGFLSAQFPAPG